MPRSLRKHDMPAMRLPLLMLVAAATTMMLGRAAMAARDLPNNGLVHAGRKLAQTPGSCDGNDAANEVCRTCNGNEYCFYVQCPWDENISQHYTPTGSGCSAVHTLTVDSSDKPFKQSSNTKPRAEMRFITPGDYTGSTRCMWFEVQVASGTKGTNIFQILGTIPGSETQKPSLQIRASDPADANSQLVLDNGTPLTNPQRGIYGNWVGVYVRHSDASGSTKGSIRVMTRQPRSGYTTLFTTTTISDEGYNDNYFKMGVYSQPQMDGGASATQTATFRNIKWASGSNCPTSNVW